MHYETSTDNDGLQYEKGVKLMSPLRDTGMNDHFVVISKEFECLKLCGTWELQTIHHIKVNRRLRVNTDCFCIITEM